MLFTDAANILSSTQMSVPKGNITSKQTKVLKEVAATLSDAEIVSHGAYHHPAGVAQNVPSWHEYWDQVRAARITLMRITNGGKPETTDIIEAARLCRSIALAK
jgi:hypothetical protein